jgi:RNA polymerase sigma-70 factor (ECF subfamily)
VGRPGAPNASDAELVDAVRRGDLAAFEVLYGRHLPGVRAAVHAQIRDAHEAADAVQETFARALASLPQLQRTELFRPWLLSIARHIAIDTRRTRRQRQPELLGAAEQLESDDPSPAELAEIAELATVVRIAIGGLSSRDATALGLVALGFGVDDVARALAIGRGAAKVALHRGRRRLRGAVLLEILTRRQVPGCPLLAEIEPDRLVAIARHLETCEACADAALIRSSGG